MDKNRLLRSNFSQQPYFLDETMSLGVHPIMAQGHSNVNKEPYSKPVFPLPPKMKRLIDGHAEMHLNR